MNNFGVVEIASTKNKHAPGWAYVPDTGLNPAVAAFQPVGRKRVARGQFQGAGNVDASARNEAKLRKEFEVLDREAQRDVQIAVPVKAFGRKVQSRHTPNVRKILQSQKNFSNHLDDYQALLALDPAATHTPFATQQTHQRRDSPAPAAAKRSTSGRKKGDTAARGKKKGSAVYVKASDRPPADVQMEDAPGVEASATEQKRHGRERAGDGGEGPAEKTSYPADGTILPAYQRAPPAPHPLDEHPLLKSDVVPLFPTDDELRAAILAPPLSYLEARSAWPAPDEADGGLTKRYPPRRFCAVCGYWGRLRCTKCGGRVCALDCLEVHKEECVTRYGL